MQWYCQSRGEQYAAIMSMVSEAGKTFMQVLPSLKGLLYSV